MNLSPAKKNTPKNLRVFGRVRVQLAKVCHIEIGNDVTFRSRMFSNQMGLNHGCSIAMMKRGANLKIGDGTGFSGVSIGCFERIEIGENVNVGANAVITDSDWHEDDPRSGGSKPVYIGDNVWIGYGSIILKGVSIGKNTVIGAGSIVVRDIPDNVVAAGNPCRVLKSLQIE